MLPHKRLSQQLVAALRKNLAGLTRSPVPEAGRLLWGIFADLCAARTYHAGGPNPISHAEIEAYARLQRWSLEPHHVEIIRDLDTAWLDHAHKSIETGIDGTSSPRRSSQAISPAIFDAMFG